MSKQSKPFIAVVKSIIIDIGIHCRGLAGLGISPSCTRSSRGRIIREDCPPGAGLAVAGGRGRGSGALLGRVPGIKVLAHPGFSQYVFTSKTIK